MYNLFAFAIGARLVAFIVFVALDLKLPLDLNQEFFSLCPQTKMPQHKQSI